jgi:hypothetical protein
MDDNGAQEQAMLYLGLAAQWRRLAANATTVRMRAHLIDKARACEALATGTGLVARPINGTSPKLSLREKSSKRV